MTTLADLQTPQTQQYFFNVLLGVYKSQGFPVESWQTGGTERTRLMAISTALADLSGAYIPDAAGGGFLDYASLSWLQLTAAQLYDILYFQATQTVGTMIATAASGAGPYTVAAGQLNAVFGDSGRRYKNISDVTIPNGGSVSFSVQAEFAGSTYNDPSNSGVITLSSPSLPGVTITNPATPFTAVNVIGAGTGTLTLVGLPEYTITIACSTLGALGTAQFTFALNGGTPSAAVTSSTTWQTTGYTVPGTNTTLYFAAGSYTTSDAYFVNTNGAVTHTSGSGPAAPTFTAIPLFPHLVVVRIDASADGSASTTSWSYSVDGQPFVSFGIGPAVDLAGTGINVTLTDGAPGVSFATGMTLTFSTPASWISSQGTDNESAVSIANRCRNRWATLSPIATNSLYQTLVSNTPTYGPQVTQMIIATDSVINDQVNIVVAGPQGALSALAVSSIQAYVGPRVPITDKPVVTTPATLPITLGGTLTVSASQLAAAQAAVTVAMDNYVQGVGINGTLRIAAIIEQVMLVAGMVDATGITINSVAANLPLGSTTSYVLPGEITLGFTWVTQ